MLSRVPQKAPPQRRGRSPWLCTVYLFCLEVPSRGRQQIKNSGSLKDTERVTGLGVAGRVGHVLPPAVLTSGGADLHPWAPVLL